MNLRYTGHPILKISRRGVFRSPICRCSRSSWRRSPILRSARQDFAAILGIIAALRRRVIGGITPRIGLFLATSLALGPGLVVNTLLKDHWGRARPHQIVEFGGNAHFSPAVLLSDQCARNCSFPSGHAALGFWLVAIAMVMPTAWRRIAMPIALGVGVLIGLMRIAQGAHFLSDVIAAAIIVIGINVLLKILILDRAINISR